jgi:hypothetical protein
MKGGGFKTSSFIPAKSQADTHGSILCYLCYLLFEFLLCALAPLRENR